MKVQLSYTPIFYTSKQFSELVEKRVKKALRHYALNIAKPIYVLDDGSKEFAVAVFLLKKLFPSKTSIIAVKNKKRPLVVPTNMERYLNAQFQRFIENKPFKTSKEILFMDCLLEEEIVAYAKLYRIPFVRSQEPLNPVIERLQKKYSETKFSLYKSIKALELHQL